MLLQGLRPDMVEALPVGIHARDMFVEFEVTGGGSYLNEEQRGRSLTRGGNATSVDAVMKGRDTQGNIRLFLIEWKYTESYPSKREKKSGSRMDNRLWRYRSFFTRDGSPFTFCNSDVDSTFFEELLTEPYYQLMRQTLLGWKMTQDPSRNGQARRSRISWSSPTAIRPFVLVVRSSQDGRGILPGHGTHLSGSLCSSLRPKSCCNR